MKPDINIQYIESQGFEPNISEEVISGVGEAMTGVIMTLEETQLRILQAAIDIVQFCKDLRESPPPSRGQVQALWPYINTLLVINPDLGIVTAKAVAAWLNTWRNNGGTD